MSPALPDAASAWFRSCGIIDLSDRTKIELSGADRAAFLHNFCTNDIRGLAAGRGCEAFVLDVKGHVLFHVFVTCRADSLVIDTVPGVGERLVKHLDRYLIREQVRFVDCSTDWAELLIVGPNAAEVICRVFGKEPPSGVLGVAEFAGDAAGAFAVRGVHAAPPNFAVFLPREGAETWRQRLAEAGAVSCDEARNAARIEVGLPTAAEIGDKTLPQELDRTDRAISFRKGCYLGQETVARLDALGHVNRTLVGLRFTSTAAGRFPQSGDELTADDQKAGQITSAAWSPRLNACVALAYVRAGKNVPGVQLESSAGRAEVVKLPMSAPTV